MNETHCCEIVNILNKRDKDGHAKLECRVYGRGEAVFTQPCDSRIIRFFTVKIRDAYVQTVSEKSLTKKAVKIPHDQYNTALFLAILHDY